MKIAEFFALATLDKGMIYTWPKLYNKNARGKLIFWEISMRIERGGDYIIADFSDNKCIGYYWTVSGHVDYKTAPKPSESTAITEGKNIGKKNATTVVTQTISTVLSIYNKQIKKGYTPDPKHLNHEITSIEDLFKRKKEYAYRVFPQALHDYKKHGSKMPDPVYVQPKFDGNRCVIVAHELIPGGIDIYSRRGEHIGGVDDILDSFRDLAIKHPGIYFDGEIWQPGKKLQEIQEIVKRKETVGTSELIFYVFDIFEIGNRDSFRTRFAKLQEIAKKFPDRIRLAETIECKKEEIDSHYKNYLDMGLEGAVIRNPSAKYEYGTDKEKRSYGVMKYKPRFDSEYRVVGFTTGEKGKEVNQIIWICETAEGLRFNVTPNETQEVRMELLEKAKKDTSWWKDKMATIEYAWTGKSGIPQQPKFKAFRE